MPQIRIEVGAESGEKFRVVVHGSRITTHHVTVTDAVRQRIAPAGVSSARLVEESFRFLLEREPNTSILSSFDLPVIGRYFPEYEIEIANRLAGDER